MKYCPALIIYRNVQYNILPTVIFLNRKKTNMADVRNSDISRKRDIYRERRKKKSDGFEVK